MFSECASSQIGSIDSYSELKEEEIEKVEVLEADLDNSDISLTGLQQGSKAGSKESILDALDFSSDEDETTGGKKKKDEKGDKKSASNVPALSCDSEKSGTGIIDTHEHACISCVLSLYVFTIYFQESRSPGRIFTMWQCPDFVGLRTRVQVTLRR